MIRLIYSLFFSLALPFIFIKLYRRGKKAPDYRKRWKERLGFCDFSLKHSIWIHSVSMGESIAVAPLVKKLIAHYPDENFVVTTMTPTGSAQVQKIYVDYDSVYHCYLPYDLQCLFGVFIRRVQPRAVIIVETELWPNMLYVCDKRKIKTILTNARLSQKSANGYKKISWLTRLMYGNINQIAAQTDEDAQRFLDIGYPKEQCITSGNLKYDIEIDEKIIDQAKSFKQSLDGRKVWVAASTHRGEDEVVFSAHQKVLKHIPGALLIVVPRHPERFKEVTTLARNFKFNVITRSSQQPIHGADIFVGDSMGEMIFYYALSDVAFIGGSLIEHGGQNMLEPSAMRLPILAGKNTFNFTEVTRLLKQSKGLTVVADSDDISKRVELLFNDVNLCKQQGLNAYNIIKCNQGALQRQFDIAIKIIDR